MNTLLFYASGFLAETCRAKDRLDLDELAVIIYCCFNFVAEKFIQDSREPFFSGRKPSSCYS